MRSTSFFTFALCALSATVLAAPVPQIDNIIGSVTNPGAGNDNQFTNNGSGNGNGNGNNNEAGNGNGNDNEAGSGNEAGNSNTFTFAKTPSLDSIKDILKKREAGLLDPAEGMLSGVTNTVGSVTDPTAGSGNTFEGNGNDNGNDNGNGNSAGNDNGNGNSAGNNNSAGNGNTFTFGEK
ncbi:hypothetical protein EK21DRAFT_100199 [Setomelanomma holmii]|uniref:Uncharacterized protein n=1 Tax=Setomelanomma holmii TaxID=210430 RepID=A0A9P4H9U1_9PLEO|nr:hypothetical protein EK21DRAFT_100199 [Setomelanomma holmii]